MAHFRHEPDRKLYWNREHYWLRADYHAQEAVRIYLLNLRDTPGVGAAPGIFAAQIADQLQQDAAKELYRAFQNLTLDVNSFWAVLVRFGVWAFLALLGGCMAAFVAGGPIVGSFGAGTIVFVCGLTLAWKFAGFLSREPDLVLRMQALIREQSREYDEVKFEDEETADKASEDDPKWQNLDRLFDRSCAAARKLVRQHPNIDRDALVTTFREHAREVFVT
ncbi:hypothetical protein CBOM_02646 [Ceraceosorus bombacis]|uniref:Uncharacterized protein n=1 Tax=Ceraceosorus bombacis TaxID=401625 RepID=A0A0P1BF75_9BASI|nr:hypothetical protein CBOM_02646 [Ceraceosorus bombacis]